MEQLLHDSRSATRRFWTIAPHVDQTQQVVNPNLAALIQITTPRPAPLADEREQAAAPKPGLHLPRRPGFRRWQTLRWPEPRWEAAQWQSPPTHGPVTSPPPREGGGIYKPPLAPRDSASKAARAHLQPSGPVVHSPARQLACLSQGTAAASRQHPSPHLAGVAQW